MAKASRTSKKTMSDYDGPMAMPAQSVSGSVKRGKPVLDSVRIEKAKNGFTLNKSYSGTHGEYYPSGKPEVFTDVDSLLTAVTKCLG